MTGLAVAVEVAAKIDERRRVLPGQMFEVHVHGYRQRHKLLAFANNM